MEKFSCVICDTPTGQFIEDYIDGISDGFMPMCSQCQEKERVAWKEDESQGDT